MVKKTIQNTIFQNKSDWKIKQIYFKKKLKWNVQKLFFAVNFGNFDLYLQNSAKISKN